MLKQRIITAIILLVVLLGALLAPGHQAFSLLMALAIACAAWEWARLSGFSGVANILWALVAVAGCLLMGLAGWQLQATPAATALVTVVSLLWLLATPLLLRAGVPSVAAHPALAAYRCRLAGTVGSLAGDCPAVGPAWVLVSAVSHGAGLGGRYCRLFLWPCLWRAPAGAFHQSGQELGRGGRRSAVCPAFCPCCVPSSRRSEQMIYADLAARSHPVVMLLAVLLLTIMSVTGDLVESLIKRSAGLKDSSQLLPRSWWRTRSH